MMIGKQFTSIEQVADQYLSQKGASNNLSVENGLSFEEILRQKQDVSQVDELKFSKHATQRLEDRNIPMTKDISDRLLDGVQKASQKGIQESLVMVDSLAFIVNVPNKTVVTAIDQNESQEKVFTNIDGAVIA